MKKIFPALSVVVTLIATLFASTASILIFYQPKTPKCLK